MIRTNQPNNNPDDGPTDLNKNNLSSGYEVLQIKSGFPKNSDFLNLLRNTHSALIDSKDPQVIINGINNLRRLLKFHREFFITLFENLYDRIRPLIQNQNEEIVIHVFTFIEELLREPWVEPGCDNWIEYFIHYILLFSTYDNLTIKNLALKCLEHIGKRAFYESTIIELLKGMQNKNNEISLNASTTLHSLLTNCDKHYLINGFDWNNLMSDIFSMYTDSKFRKLGEGLLKTMKSQIFSKEEFDDLLTHLDDDILKNMMTVFDFNYAEIRKIRINREKEFEKIFNSNN